VTPVRLAAARSAGLYERFQCEVLYLMSQVQMQ